MTTKEAADYLGVTQGRVRQLIMDGVLHAVKRGRDNWVERAEVERYQSERKPRGWPAGRPRSIKPEGGSRVLRPQDRGNRADPRREGDGDERH